MAGEPHGCSIRALKGGMASSAGEETAMYSILPNTDLRNPALPLVAGGGG